MTEAEMDAIIKTDAGGEVTYRDRRVFLAAIEYASAYCDALLVGGETQPGRCLREQVAQLG